MLPVCSSDCLFVYLSVLLEDREIWDCKRRGRKGVCLTATHIPFLFISFFFSIRYTATRDRTAWIRKMDFSREMRETRERRERWGVGSRNSPLKVTGTFQDTRENGIHPLMFWVLALFISCVSQKVGTKLRKVSSNSC